MLVRDPNYHPTRDMPQCQWIGSHRYDFDSHTVDGQIVERCMDCKTKTRIIPDRSDEAFAKRKAAAASVTELPLSAADQLVGDGRARL